MLLRKIHLGFKVPTNQGLKFALAITSRLKSQTVKKNFLPVSLYVRHLLLGLHINLGT